MGAMCTTFGSGSVTSCAALTWAASDVGRPPKDAYFLELMW